MKKNSDGGRSTLLLLIYQLGFYFVRTWYEYIFWPEDEQYDFNEEGETCTRYMFRSCRPNSYHAATRTRIHKNLLRGTPYVVVVVVVVVVLTLTFRRSSPWSHERAGALRKSEKKPPSNFSCLNKYTRDEESAQKIKPICELNQHGRGYILSTIT